jgi:integrase
MTAIIVGPTDNKSRDGDVRKMSEGCPPDAVGEHRPVVMLLSYVGLRFGGLAALRLRRVDLMRRRIEIVESVTEVNGVLTFGTPKAHQRRSVPLPGFLADDLRPLLGGKRPDELVFTAPGGGPLRLMNWRHRAFDPAVRAAGLDGLTPHELRHTAASLAVAAGTSVKDVQRMLGHASAAMTLDVYAGLFEDALDDLGDRLDATARESADRLRTAASSGGRVTPLSDGKYAGQRGWGTEPVGRVRLERTTDGL